ncbi:MAG: hypothetical protein RLZZ195_1023 [Pseudomonadota bacterium]|jgi:hypothetical protein
MQRVDLDQELVRMVARSIPCIHMNTDFLAANAISVFLKYLKNCKENSLSLDDAINNIKLKDVE